MRAKWVIYLYLGQFFYAWNKTDDWQVISKFFDRNWNCNKKSAMKSLCIHLKTKNWKKAEQNGTLEKVEQTSVNSLKNIIMHKQVSWWQQLWVYEFSSKKMT